MENILKIKKEHIRSTLILAAIIVLISTLIIQSFAYKTETEMVNTIFEKHNLPHPSFNNTTNFFEYRNGASIYVGYTTYKNMDENRLVLMEFKNASVENLSGRYVYVAEDNEVIVIEEKTIRRRFLF